MKPLHVGIYSIIFAILPLFLRPKRVSWAGVGGDLMGVMGKVGRGGKRRRSLRLMAATMD
jgi:hypothetical protein